MADGGSDDLVPMGDVSYEVSAASIEAQERDAALRAQLELRKLERTVAVPTNEADVKRMLRELGEPITLFAETVWNQSKPFVLMPFSLRLAVSVYVY